MKFYIAVTDNNWFSYLSHLHPDEINFWQPGGSQTFAALEPNSPFLFKLHSPQNYIVGGGFFVRHSLLPVSLAWDSFNEKNGAPDFQTFKKHIHKYRSQKGKTEIDPFIGCIILASPFFFPEPEWIPVPSDWKPNIVQGKTYDTRDLIGRTVWNQVQERLNGQTIIPIEEANQVSEERERYGQGYVTRPRMGQGSFRVLVTEAYQRRCAITGERTLPVLNASHIKPYSENGPHEVRNGLLLREDIHTLFDRGYMTVTADYRIEVSKRIKEDYGNGRDYYALHGKKLLILPDKVIEQPSQEFIEWHNRNVYVS